MLHWNFTHDEKINHCGGLKSAITVLKEVLYLYSEVRNPIVNAVMIVINSSNTIGEAA